jgi:hypothetical protein
MKTFNIYVDVVESFTVPIEANSKEEALEKAKYVNPSDHNVPHYSENKVIGADDIEQDYNNIGVWKIELYRLDDDGNPLTDKKGNVIKYEYKHLETMIDTDYINVDDLEESDNETN